MDLNVDELKLLLMKFEYEANAFGLTNEEKSLMNKLENKYKELGGYVKEVHMNTEESYSEDDF